MGGLTKIGFALLQLPGTEAPEQGVMDWANTVVQDSGFMFYPLAFALLIGILVIIWKLFDIGVKGRRTRNVLDQVDELLAQHDIEGAARVCEESDAPASNIILAGLERRDEGTERVMKAIENQGLIELSKMERGLVVLATLTNVAPLLGFLGTVIGMIVAFQAIELAGEVEATLVAGGIKIALLTTAEGLTIAIPVSIMHNYFVSRIDRLVIEMEESAQRMIDALHEMEGGAGGTAAAS